MKENGGIVKVGNLNYAFTLMKRSNNQAHCIKILLNCKQLLLKPGRV